MIGLVPAPLVVEIRDIPKAPLPYVGPVLWPYFYHNACVYRNLGLYLQAQVHHLGRAAMSTSQHAK